MSMNLKRLSLVVTLIASVFGSAAAADAVSDEAPVEQAVEVKSDPGARKWVAWSQ